MTIARVFVDVDVQNDFCEPDGALYVKGSPNETFRALTRFAVAERIPILGSVDSHAWDAWEFASSETRGPAGEKPGFPDHCVKGTPGWLKVKGTLPPRFRFIPNVPDAFITVGGDPPDAPHRSGLASSPGSIASVVGEVVRGATQGVYFEKEVYSLFANPVAEPFLAALGAAPEFVVYGVATDYCVRAAALGLAERGYRTTLLTDAIAGITPEGTRAALEALAGAGVRLSTAAEVLR